MREDTYSIMFRLRRTPRTFRGCVEFFFNSSKTRQQGKILLEPKSLFHAGLPFCTVCPRIITGLVLIEEWFWFTLFFFYINDPVNVDYFWFFLPYLTVKSLGPSFVSLD